MTIQSEVIDNIINKSERTEEEKIQEFKSELQSWLDDECGDLEEIKTLKEFKEILKANFCKMT